MEENLTTYRGSWRSVKVVLTDKETGYYEIIKDVDNLFDINTTNGGNTLARMIIRYSDEETYLLTKLDHEKKILYYERHRKK